MSILEYLLQCILYAEQRLKKIIIKVNYFCVQKDLIDQDIIGMSLNKNYEIKKRNSR